VPLFHRARTRSKPWYEKDHGTLLEHERAVVAASYPSLEFARNEGTGRMRLLGQIVLVADCGVETRIAVRLEFPRNYPQAEPKAYDDAKRFPWENDRHILPSGQFCLWLPPRSPWDANDPLRLQRFLDEVAVFLERQLVYEATGGHEWPGQQYSHGVHGYEEFMLSMLDGDAEALRRLLPILRGDTILGRNDLCSCGSGRKYKRCHLNTVEEITGRIGKEHLNWLYRRKKPPARVEAQQSEEVVHG